MRLKRVRRIGFRRDVRRGDFVSLDYWPGSWARMIVWIVERRSRRYLWLRLRGDN